MTMITPSYLGETIEYSSLHACRSTLEDPTNENREVENRVSWGGLRIENIWAAERFGLHDERWCDSCTDKPVCRKEI